MNAVSQYKIDNPSNKSLPNARAGGLLYNQSNMLVSKVDKPETITISREIYEHLPKLYQAVVDWGKDLGEIVLI